MRPVAAEHFTCCNGDCRRANPSNEHNSRRRSGQRRRLLAGRRQNRGDSFAGGLSLNGAGEVDPSW